MAQGTLLNVVWQPGWEGSLGENGYTCMYGWVPLLFTCNYHNIVNQLYPIQKKKELKKIKEHLVYSKNTKNYKNISICCLCCTSKLSEVGKGRLPLPFCS